MNLRNYRQTASQLLAASIFELFPSVDLWKVEATDTGFVLEGYFPHPINPDTLFLIEERMKQIVREKRPIRTLEMAPLSAFELLRKEGHETQCRLLEEVEGNLVEVIEIGSFHSLSEGPHLKNTSELSAFKLLSLKKLPDRGLSIQGAVSTSKEELKNFLKQLLAYEKASYQILGQNNGFWKFFDEGIVWFEKGLQARQQIQDLFFLEAPLVQCSGETLDLLSQFRRDCRQIISCSTKDLHHSPYAIRKTNFCTPQDFFPRINSSLHSIYKILIILGFDCWVRTTEKRRDWREIDLPEKVRLEKIEGIEPCIELMVEDPILRPMSIASIRKLKLPSDSTQAFVCEAFVEKILVLLLEMNLKRTWNELG